jgi:outer membrane protein assembly factor BamA
MARCIAPPAPWPLTLVIVACLTVAPRVAQAQQPAGRASSPRREITGIPAINFNSDEGFGYGVVVQYFDYGDSARPYRYTIQPTLFFTTRGRRDVSVFFDAPHFLPDGWRLGAYVGREQQLATPYYGIGNVTPYDSAAELPPNPYYYRYGRTGYRVTADLQRTIGPSVRVLLGVGLRTVEINKTPFDSGTTLLVGETGAAAFPTGQASTVRAGVVFDTRDEEVGPHHGLWIEALLQLGGKVLGGTAAFNRATVTARGYVSPVERVTLAERVIVQNLTGTVPFYDLFTVQGSFSDDEGLGGSGTLRGWPKDRFAGKGLLLSNSECRFRAAGFPLLGRPSSVVLSAFLDAGRVWTDQVHLDEVASDLHVGVGLGARLAWGRSFVVALDAGHSPESAASLYIGLGYLF